ncbi:endonuclease/exonuclease/phosphatase family protein [Chryseobacterium sp. SSA4.19]|uniref:endonuclease/exonuclease/phosphatase family protein n=1 Tax=Chryseobacterium sp. SSA4.19 TaxID=2919915 RepID=UPI001F4E9F06|nr:endonuclease/exonuclease/phosphatase family protein [Chryseobacterium sp. SSA4.19]MCJ8152912.1 endonuclease/exonuclease/phosphatase family protein [Chryseobacterium sp. SSA4.19]
MKIVRLIFLIIHIGIFFLLVGMLLNTYVPPKVFPWFNLISLGFPVLMTGYIVLTVFWVFCWKKRAVVFLLLGLMFFNATIRWINYTPEKKDVADLKIVSFNTKDGQISGKKDLEDYLNSQHADVMFLQEESGYQINFKGYTKGGVKSLTTLFTKHEIIDEKLIDPDTESIASYGTQTDIKIRGRIYRFINVYLHPFKFKKSMVKLNGNSDQDEKKIKNIIGKLIPTFKLHQEEVAAIRKAVENSPYPVIMAGDFNSVPNSYEYYHLSEDLKDAFMETGKGSATSFHDYKFPIRIDYVFSSKSIQPISYKVDRSVRISDHFPVIATFKLEH